MVESSVILLVLTILEMRLSPMTMDQPASIHTQRSVPIDKINLVTMDQDLSRTSCVECGDCVERLCQRLDIAGSIYGKMKKNKTNTVTAEIFEHFLMIDKIKWILSGNSIQAVSYTHLTLPTIA